MNLILSQENIKLSDLVLLYLQPRLYVRALSTNRSLLAITPATIAQSPVNENSIVKMKEAPHTLTVEVVLFFRGVLLLPSVSSF